jgi:hypothetical protein
MNHRISFVAEKRPLRGAIALRDRVLMPCIRKPSVAAVLITCAVEERRHCLLQPGNAAVEAPGG